MCDYLPVNCVTTLVFSDKPVSPENIRILYPLSALYICEGYHCFPIHC
uniref:Uncharacterized protein n=1 Tax=Arundo donax TaxID=35708 RepID=A0A0A9GM97_ARUDO